MFEHIHEWLHTRYIKTQDDSSWIVSPNFYKETNYFFYFFYIFMKKFFLLLPVVLTFFASVFADDLANVSLSYCNTQESTLQYQIEPSIETGICYMLSNASKKPVMIKLSFIDGTFTNDQRKNKACLSDVDRENFWQYVTGYDQLITLKPGETIKKEANLLYPKGMDGLYHWCVVYSVVEKKKSTASDASASFSILMRRAKFIDVIVGNPENAKEKGIVLEDFSDADGKNISNNSKIRMYEDDSDNKYVVQLKIKNISPVEQDVVITWVASNLLTYKNTFVETRKILKGESIIITKKIDEMPSYNLSIKFNIENTPFTFGWQKPIIGTTKEKTTIRIWNTITFITIVGILLLIGIVLLLIKDIQRKRGKRIGMHKQSTKKK